MRLKAFAILSASLCLAVTTACSDSTPLTPTDGTSTTKGSVSLVAGQPAAPATGAQFAFAAQPVTLTVANGVTTGGVALTYGFEVASDAAFTTKVYTKDGVPQGTGQTSLVIDNLAGSKTYYWHSRVTGGGTVGPYSAARSFTIGAQVVIQAPVLVSPSPNATATGTATLTITNSQTSGPAGPITYRFDVSSSSSFSPVAYTTTVAQQAGGQTSVTVPANTLPSGTFFWRVQATDTTNSIVATTMASSFQFVNFDMRQAKIWGSPSDLGSWTATATITRIDLTSYVIADFDKRDGPNRWPDEQFGDGSIEYTLGMCLNYSGGWNCSAAIQFWYGRELTAGGSVSDIAINWFYDPVRWGTMAGHQPAPGELVGIFVGAGNLRGRTDPSYVLCPNVCERSNVVLLPWGSTYSK